MACACVKYGCIVKIGYGRNLKKNGLKRLFKNFGSVNFGYDLRFSLAKQRVKYKWQFGSYYGTYT